MEKTLNLTDNPFDPDLPIIGRVSGDPLRPDLYEKYTDEPRKALRELLSKLLCMDIAGMAAAEAALPRALFRDKDPASASVQRNAILLIVGPRGSGRSTLANRVAALILQKRKSAEAIEEWERFDLVFDRHLPPPDLKGAFDSKRAEITGKYANRSGRVVLVIDNLPKSSFDYVLSAFDAFPQLSRVFIVTTTDTELLQDRELDASGIHIEPVELTRLTAEEVRAFIKDRVPKFHADDFPALQNQSDLSLFPFAESFALAMAEKPKPLQMVRTWAYKRIDERHDELSKRPGLIEAAAAEPAELRNRLIEL
jgi:energy-coupling factor transporter ATP-binding protein EcfA2